MSGFFPEPTWQLSQNYKYHVKNEDKIDESHKSQLKFEYEIYLLNYTIKIKTYIGLLRFLKFFLKNLV